MFSEVKCQRGENVDKIHLKCNWNPSKKNLNFFPSSHKKTTLIRVVPHSRIYSPVRDKNHKFIFKSLFLGKNSSQVESSSHYTKYHLKRAPHWNIMNNKFETDSLIRVEAGRKFEGSGGEVRMNENFVDEKLSVHRNRDWISARSPEICIKLWGKIDHLYDGGGEGVVMKI